MHARLLTAVGGLSLVAAANAGCSCLSCDCENPAGMTGSVPTPGLFGIAASGIDPCPPNFVLTTSWTLQPQSYCTPTRAATCLRVPEPDPAVSR